MKWIKSGSLVNSTLAGAVGLGRIVGLEDWIFAVIVERDVMGNRGDVDTLSVVSEDGLVPMMC